MTAARRHGAGLAEWLCHAMAASLQRADQSGSLESHFNPLPMPEEREVAAVEGWILGVV